MTEPRTASPSFKELLDLLACPKCKGVVRLVDGRGFVCEACRLLYAIEDEIPNFLVDDAKPWSG